MAMQMSFEAGTHVTLWLRSWRTSSVGSYVASLLFLALLAVSSEALSAFRHRLSNTGGDGNAVRPDVEGGGGASDPLLGFFSARASSTRKHSFLLALLYTLNMAIAYLLMLAVMTYNVGFFVVIILGFGLGHYVTSGQRIKAMQGGDLCCPVP